MKLLRLVTAVFTAVLINVSCATAQEEEMRSCADLPGEGALATITHDDGRNHAKAVTIMQKYGLVATIYPYTNNIETPVADPLSKNITWKELGELVKSGWEIGAHTISHQDLIDPDLDEYDLSDEIEIPPKAIERRLEVKVTSFASPYGNVNEAAMAMIKKVYKNHVKAWGETIEGMGEGFNSLAEIDPYNLGRLTATRDTLPELMRSYLRKALKKKGGPYWFIIAFHQVVDSIPDMDDPNLTEEQKNLYHYAVTTADFEVMMKCVAEAAKAGKIKVVTVSQGVDMIIGSKAVATKKK